MATEDFRTADYLLPIGIHRDEKTGSLQVDDMTPELLEDVRTLVHLIAARQVSGQLDKAVSLENEFNHHHAIIEEIVAETATDGIRRKPGQILASVFETFPFFVLMPVLTRGTRHIKYDPEISEGSGA